MTTTTAAAILDVTRDQVSRLVRTKRLSARRTTGGCWEVNGRSVRKYRRAQARRG